jgi:hypothetical protein
VSKPKSNFMTTEMKRITLVCVAATVLFTTLCGSSAYPAAGVDTKTAATKFYSVGGDAVFTTGRFAYQEG